MAPHVVEVDHFVLTVRDLKATVAFYGRALGMRTGIEHGPDQADGARGPLRSIWIRDPDGNLIELANRQGPSRTVD